MYQIGPCGGLVTESPESLELRLEVSERNEHLEASSLCRCAQRLRPINQPEFAGEFFDTGYDEDAVWFQDEVEGREDLL